jgi:hypothetical protein
VLSHGYNRIFTGFQSPPRPPSQRLPWVAAGPQHDDDDYNTNLSGAGSTLTTRPSGLKDGVHLTALQKVEDKLKGSDDSVGSKLDSVFEKPPTDDTGSKLDKAFEDFDDDDGGF